MRPYLTYTAYCLACLVLGLGFLTFWLANPFDRTVWRIKVNAPVIGALSLRADPAIKLALSKPVRFLLADTQWQSRFGLVRFSKNKAGLLVVCQVCQFPLPAFSKAGLRFEKLALSAGQVDKVISGTLEITRGNKPISLSYSAVRDSDGMHVNWSLPNTQIGALVKLIEETSPVLGRAKITGEIAVVGTLDLPALTWRVNPDVQGFTVNGLGTEMLKSADIVYRCTSPTLIQNKVGNKPIPAYQWVPDNQMGRWLPRAVIIAEDAHFKEHPGFNLDAIRSILAQSSQRKPLGGSTLTQQLAKNFFTGGERTWLRKLEELLYAVEMENTLGKRRIFNLYLNTADWGPGICGIGQAAQIYFAKKPNQLTPAQAAWLAGMLRNPRRAWSEQFVTNRPDMKRIVQIMHFMPKRAKTKQSDLAFTIQGKKLI